MRRRPKTRSGNLPRMPLFLRYGLLFTGEPVMPSQAGTAELCRQAVRTPPPASSGVLSRSCLRRPRERRAGHGRWVCGAQPRRSVVPSARSACHSMAPSGTIFPGNCAYADSRTTRWRRVRGLPATRWRRVAGPWDSAARSIGREHYQTLARRLHAPHSPRFATRSTPPNEVAHEIPNCRQSSFMSTNCI